MAIIKVTNSKASIRSAIKYITQEEKTDSKLISGINCNAESAINEMQITKELFKKTEGRQYAHYIHSFKPGEQITHEKAHKLALELSEKQFKGYEVLVATHKDKDHIHSHIIVNSVSYEDGRKLHSSKKDLAEVKELSNKICEREGLSITRHQNDVLTSFNANKYKALERAVKSEYKSYMLDLFKDINSILKKATCKEDFIAKMTNKGYGVVWNDTRKNITFITPEGKKIRNSNLVKTFKNNKFSKEGLLNEFISNRETIRGKGTEERNEFDIKSSNRGAEQYFNATDEQIRSRTYEGREYRTEKTTSDLYTKLREIRRIGDEYSPTAREENRKRAERIERECNECKSKEYGEINRAKEQQSTIKRKSKRSYEHER